MLWCPSDHGELRCPLTRVYWRSSHDVDQVRATPSPHAEASKEYVPDPCVVHPERVTEYPDGDLPEDLSDLLCERFDRLRRETGWSYRYHLSDAPGIKVGGYPGWTQEPVWPECGWCERARAAHNPAGLVLGDAGGVYVFESRCCPERPTDHWFGFS